MNNTLTRSEQFSIVAMVLGTLAIIFGLGYALSTSASHGSGYGYGNEGGTGSGYGYGYGEDDDPYVNCYAGLETYTNIHTTQQRRVLNIDWDAVQFETPEGCDYSQRPTGYTVKVYNRDGSGYTSDYPVYTTYVSGGTTETTVHLSRFDSYPEDLNYVVQIIAERSDGHAFYAGSEVFSVERVRGR